MAVKQAINSVTPSSELLASQVAYVRASAVPLTAPNLKSTATATGCLQRPQSV